mmetsp:Transcript_26684/g.39645  ORF Transcript_26684/g.39645 Transcript_26684/m.39645 type:complete len:453 (+) Transcript_26684:14-1372(+)
MGEISWLSTLTFVLLGIVLHLFASPYITSYLRYNHSERGIWVRRWAADYLSRNTWKGEHAWIKRWNASGVLDAYRLYLSDRTTIRESHVLHSLWSEAKDYSSVELSKHRQVVLLRAFLSLNICPILDSLLCDKRALSAQLHNVTSESRLIHPRSYMKYAPPFVGKQVRRELSTLPDFPVNNTYFLKDPTMNEGKGIIALPPGTTHRDIEPLFDKGHILQEGISNPLLLPGGYKFTFELFLFVTRLSTHSATAYLSVDGTVDVSHTPYTTHISENAKLDTTRAAHVTNIHAQIGGAEMNENGCPEHPTLNDAMRSWQVVLQHLSDMGYNTVALRNKIKSVVEAAVESTFDVFDFSDISLKDTVWGAKDISLRDICQTMYGIDFILSLPEAESQSIDVQILEIQMNPNIPVHCPAELEIYSRIASSVWDIIAHVEDSDKHILDGSTFEKIDFVY